MKYIDKFQKIMRGRYGIDELYKFLFNLYIVLVILNLFIKSNVLLIIELVIVMCMFYRFFSKKIYKRSNENQMFLRIKNRLCHPLKNVKRNIKDKEHIYKKCHKCKTILKLPLPSKRGIKKAKCPKCGKRVRFITFKQEKIEVYRNGKRIK